MQEVLLFALLGALFLVGRKAIQLQGRLRATEAALKKAQAQAAKLPVLGQKVAAAQAATKQGSNALKLEAAARLKAEELAGTYKSLLGAALALRYADAGRNPANAAKGGYLHPEVRVDLSSDTVFVTVFGGVEVAASAAMKVSVGGRAVDVVAALHAEAAARFSSNNTTNP